MNDRDKLFTWQTLALVLGGIAVNILGARFALWLELPVFLDSIGTIIVAALGGFLPGITAGFFSNVLNSIGDPITLYYGIISILIAVLAAYFSEKRVFQRFYRTLFSTIPFAFVGGIIGSLLTWMLYGLNFGDGTSAGFVMRLYRGLHLSPFFAQLLGDLLIDLIDKLITVLIVFLLLRCFPRKYLEQLPMGQLYARSRDALAGCKENAKE